MEGTFLHTHYNAASGTPKPSGGIFLHSSWGGLQSALVPNGNPGGIKLYRSRRRPAMKNAHAIQPDISATSPHARFCLQRHDGVRRAFEDAVRECADLQKMSLTSNMLSTWL